MVSILIVILQFFSKGNIIFKSVDIIFDMKHLDFLIICKISIQILSFGLLNLSHLVIKAAELYEIEDISRLPKLTHLTLKTVTYGVSMSKMFQNYHSRHKGITRLELEFMPSEDEQDTQAAEKIVKLFPGVTQFKINLDGAQNLAKTMRPFRAWRLASGEVNIEEVKSADVVAAVLEGLAEWRGTFFRKK